MRANFRQETSIFTRFCYTQGLVAQSKAAKTALDSDYWMSSNITPNDSKIISWHFSPLTTPRILFHMPREKEYRVCRR